MSLAAFFTGIASMANQKPAAPQWTPKLVLTLVIDQFRADTLMRFNSRFAPARDKTGKLGGFHFLTEEGAYVPYASYEILQSMTGPGHATILTGSYPYRNGIAANYWYDSKTEQSVYCVDDSSQSLVGIENSEKIHSGTSPKNLFGTTLGDEMKNAGYPSRVVSIAIKDRSAILMGGFRADATLWFEPKNFKWVSSTFYFPNKKLPDWVTQMNQSLEKKKNTELTWMLSPISEMSGFSSEKSMALTDEYNAGKIGGTGFPHKVAHGTKNALLLPFGIDMTEELAEKAIEGLKLGTSKTPDLLAVSFSTHDYLAHAFGPNSQEIEEMTIAEDRALSRLFNFLNRHVPGGIENVLIALTADHGGPNSPEYLTSVKVPSGRIDEEKIQADLEKLLITKFGAPKGTKNWIIGDDDLQLYLSAKAIETSSHSKLEIETFGKEYLKNIHGVARVITSSEIESGLFPPALLGSQVAKTAYTQRMGNWIMIPQPYFIGAGDTTQHLTGYAYDRMVPLILRGKGIKPGKFAINAHVVDLAPTLAWFVHSLPPAACEGRILNEIIK